MAKFRLKPLEFEVEALRGNPQEVGRPELIVEPLQWGRKWRGWSYVARSILASISENEPVRFYRREMRDIAIPLDDEARAMLEVKDGEV